MEIVGLNLTGYFYINKIKEDFAKIMRIKVNIRSPKVESKIYLLRKLLWQNNSNIIVSAKPCLNLNITGAEIKTNLAKLLCFKIFTKSNFDEKSKFVEDIFSKWDSIDFSFDIG